MHVCKHLGLWGVCVPGQHIFAYFCTSNTFLFLFLNALHAMHLACMAWGIRPLGGTTSICFQTAAVLGKFFALCVCWANPPPPSPSPRDSGGHGQAGLATGHVRIETSRLGYAKMATCSIRSIVGGGGCCIFYFYFLRWISEGVRERK